MSEEGWVCSTQEPPNIVVMVMCVGTIFVGTVHTYGNGTIRRLAFLFGPQIQCLDEVQRPSIHSEDHNTWY